MTLTPRSVVIRWSKVVWPSFLILRNVVRAAAILAFPNIWKLCIRCRIVSSIYWRSDEHRGDCARLPASDIAVSPEVRRKIRPLLGLPGLPERVERSQAGGSWALRFLLQW